TSEPFQHLPDATNTLAADGFADLLATQASGLNVARADRRGSFKRRARDVRLRVVAILETGTPARVRLVGEQGLLESMALLEGARAFEHLEEGLRARLLRAMQMRVPARHQFAGGAAIVGHGQPFAQLPHQFGAALLVAVV